MIQHTVHVVDDDDSFRKAIGRLLGASGLHVELYESATQFLEARIENTPGCILLDVHMPSMTGLELQALLNLRGATLPIIFLTGAGDIPMSVSAIKAGANNFLSKPVEKDLLLDTIKNAFAQYDESHEEQAQRIQHKLNLASLTKREREVLDLLITGKLNKQVAAELGMAERTTKAHRKQIMEKMKVRSLAELATVMTKF